MTKKIVVSSDVIFDELGSWYNPKQNADIDVDDEREDGNTSENERRCYDRDGNKAGQQSPTSIVCNGPPENSCDRSESNVWSGKTVQQKSYDIKKGKQKMLEYETLDKESKNVEDVDLDVLSDEELSTQALKTPGVTRAMKDAI